MSSCTLDEIKEMLVVLNKNIEKMTEVSTDDKIRELINTIYKV